MKLNKPEITVIAITAAAIFFTFGFFTGRITGKTNISFSVAGAEASADVSAVPSHPTDDSIKSAAININTASADELSNLDGIGPVLAKRIVEHREKYGPFKSIGQIMDVEGVGDGKYENIKDYICVS